MISAEGQGYVGSVSVLTSNGRPHTPEEWANLAANRIISIGSESHPAIREQALAFRQQIRQIVAYYIKEAVQSDRLFQTKG